MTLIEAIKKLEKAVSEAINQSEQPEPKKETISAKEAYEQGWADGQEALREESNGKMAETDLISRQAAIDELNERQRKLIYCFGFENDMVKMMNIAKGIVLAIPSAQSGQSNASEFWRKRADYYSDMCMNLIGEMGKGVKIESVKISENGIEFIKEQPPAQSDPQWIPWNSGKFPEESGTYIVTAYDGVTKRVTYAKYQKRLKQWELTGARAYWRVLAWMPLPEPYRED